MNAGEASFVVVALAATVVTVGWMLLNRRHPENSSGHGGSLFRARRSPPTDRPADAGAESQVAEPASSNRQRSPNTT